MRPIDEGQIICLKVTLPGTTTHIKASARVARSNDSRKGGSLRFVDLSEDARQRVGLWVSDHSGDTVRFATFRSGTDGRHASAAMNPPELAADSPATEEVRILEAARISGTPKAKPGEAEKRQGISFGEHGASHKSLEPAGFKSRQIPPAAASKLASIRQTVNRTQGPTEPIKPLPSPRTP